MKNIPLLIVSEPAFQKKNTYLPGTASFQKLFGHYFLQLAGKNICRCVWNGSIGSLKHIASCCWKGIGSSSRLISFYQLNEGSRGS
jgi:hypothetical protein